MTKAHRINFMPVVVHLHFFRLQSKSELGSVCKMRLPGDARIVRPLVFGPMVHKTIRLEYMRDTGLAEELVWTQVNDATANNPMDCKPESSRNAN